MTYLSLWGVWVFLRSFSKEEKRTPLSPYFWNDSFYCGAGPVVRKAAEGICANAPLGRQDTQRYPLLHLLLFLLIHQCPHVAVHETICSPVLPSVTYRWRVGGRRARRHSRCARWGSARGCSCGCSLKHTWSRMDGSGTEENRKPSLTTAISQSHIYEQQFVA